MSTSSCPPSAWERWVDEPPDAHLLGYGAVGALERQLSAWYNLPYSVATSSATTALHGLALALGLTTADFITTPYTWAERSPAGSCAAIARGSPMSSRAR